MRGLPTGGADEGYEPDGGGMLPEKRDSTEEPGRGPPLKQTPYLAEHHWGPPLLAAPAAPTPPPAKRLPPRSRVRGLAQGLGEWGPPRTGQQQ